METREQRIKNIISKVTKEVKDYNQEVVDLIDVHFDDIMYLPLQYHKVQKKQPYFPGKGQFNVNQLENLLEDFTEYVHQQNVIKQNLKEIVVELKFGK